MRLVDVLRDLALEASGQIQVQHSRVRQIQLLVKLGRLLTELFHITGHVTNNDGVGNGTDRAQDESREEFKAIRSWHNLAHTEHVESCVQQHQVLGPEGVVALVETLVGLTLQDVHKVHVLHPALLL